MKRTQRQSYADLPREPIARVPSATERTASWRTLRPIITLAKCTKCNVCWKVCPDIAIRFDAEGWPEIDFDHCKGCGICANECVPEAIAMVREAEA